ncbi:hypothetical protein ADU59_21945 [Pararhizobium polonicum]|uniref:ABC transmembrane type-1 domain-containing protein n=1 Tax=Pararhizobium polonicum TaxID=1612624 RepID=A0A1C7NWW4_9HYPH|nr:ABC transporter permease [Pararhizobium polonicum]OBZ93508.1 hypothetical protein ADU59_21945 [Pararhizobium polonicum]
MDIKTLIVQRLISLILVMVGASILIFIVIRVLPGDPIASILGMDASSETVTRMQVELGLDQPLPVQYWQWLTDALRGDFGNSFTFKLPVAQTLSDRFPRTVILSLASITVAFAIAVPAGIVAARFKGRAPDHLARLAALIGLSMPAFWLGLLLIFTFGVQLQLLPTSGFVWPSEDPLESLRHLILPAITLGTAYAGTIMRMLRASLIDILARDYILAGRAAGIPERRLLWHDALRNAMVPTLTVAGFAFGVMLSGTVLTEVIFNIPGIGRLLFEGILSRDYPLVQAIVLLNVLLFIGINFIVDILYIALDPRLRG